MWVPYHLDELLPDLDLPLQPDKVVTADLPAGDVWARLTALYLASRPRRSRTHYTLAGSGIQPAG